MKITTMLLKASGYIFLVFFPSFVYYYLDRVNLDFNVIFTMSSLIRLLHEKEKRNAANMIVYNIKSHKDLKHILMSMNTLVV